MADTLTSIGGVGGTWYSDTAYRKKGRQLAIGWSDVCIVPKPGNCKQYYVFTSADYSNSYYLNYGGGLAGAGANGYKPFFSLIDMSGTTPGAPYGELGLNITNTLTYIPTGGSTPKPLPGGGHIADLYVSTNTTPSGGTGKPFAFGNVQYACTKLISGSYRFLFVTTDIEIIVYKIDATGINFLYNYNLRTLPNAIYSQFTASTLGNSLAELECHVDSIHNTVNVAIGGQGGVVAFASFQMTGTTPPTGSLTGFANAYFGSPAPTKISGLEYSPDGNTLYVMSDIGIGYFTGGSTTYVPLSPSGMTVSDFIYSQMELAKDGNIYFVGQNGSSSPRMAKISNPNTPGSIVFTDNVPSLASYSSAVKTMNCLYNGGTSTIPVTTFYLPDQIDQEVYGNQFSQNQACCLFYTPYDRFTYSAGINQPTGFTGTTQTWSQNTTAGYHQNPLTLTTSDTVTIGEELRIPAGYTVTINNMKIKFSPQARLIIENANSGKHAGKLILSGCTLTVDNRCIIDMWPGVQIWGIPTNTQSGNSQAYFSATNSVIENAYVGVLAGYDATWHSTITPPPSSYVSSPSNPLGYIGTVPTSGSGAGGGIVYLSGTTFLNNQKGAVFYDYSFPILYSRVTGCTFNTNAALIGGASAIYDMEFDNMSAAGFNIFTTIFEDSYNNYTLFGIKSTNSSFAIQTSTFTNMADGIYAYNTPGNPATFSCKYSYFTNNKLGINTSYVNNAAIEIDTFRLYNATNFTVYNYTGLAMDNCTGYNVQKNHFTQYTGGNGRTRGLFINNSGPHVNCIYNNSFYNLYKGSQAQYRNYITDTTPGLNRNEGGGLIYLCNTFTSPITNGDIYVPGAGLSTNIGTTHTDSAGINYSQGTGMAYPLTGGNQFSHSSGASAYDFYIDTLAKSFNSNYVYCYTCGSSYIPLKRKNVNPAPISYNITCSDDPYANHGLRTSGTVNNQVNTDLAGLVTGTEAYKQTYDSLNTVLSGLPSNSPQALKIRRLMNNVFTSRHLLLDKTIQYYLRIAQDTIQGKAADSASAKIKNLVKIKAMELPARVRVQVGIDTHDSAMAATALSHVINEEGQTNFVKLHSVLLQNISKTANQIMADQSNIQLMQQLDKDSSDRLTYCKANMMLRVIGLSDYTLYYQDDENSGADNDQARTAGIQNNMYVSPSTLFNQPNPFKESTSIQAHVVEKTQNAFVVVTDMLGAEIARYAVQQGDNTINISAANMAQTVMFCTLVVDGVKIKTNKMVLIK
ncbi:MAG: hypothetical protein ABI448_09485 [Bacteroidia bacterium]